MSLGQAKIISFLNFKYAIEHNLLQEWYPNIYMMLRIVKIMDASGMGHLGHILEFCLHISKALSINHTKFRPKGSNAISKNCQVLDFIRKKIGI